MKTPEKRKAEDAKRLRQQSAKGNLFHAQHPEYNREKMRARRAEFGREPRHLIEEAHHPLTIKEDRIIVACDWHIPFHDAEFVSTMIRNAKEFDIQAIAVPGDFWDCDNYSHFTRLSWAETFKQEIAEVAMQLQILVDTFDRVYFCRGNHEKRWIDMNLGMVGMEELFYMTGITEGYEITLDDHMRLKSGKENWLLAHPRNFRQTPLSVARDLASKYRMNVVSAHGHQWTQGADRSGHYLCLDGGGMFDASELEYLRCTSCYPAVQGGYYIIAGGVPVPVKNEGGVKIP